MEAVESWTRHWTSLSKDSNLNGFVQTIHEAEEVRKAFEVEKSLTFVSGRKNANFGKHDDVPKKSRVRFNDIGDRSLIPYDGIPFVIISTYERNCNYGIDKHKKAKERQERGREIQLKCDHPVPKRRKKLLQASKKKGCKAKIVMKEVMVFPDYKVHKNTEKICRCVSEKLRDDLDDPKVNVTKERRIYIALPKDEHHKDKHLLGQLTGFMNPLSKVVRDKLVEMVGHGVTSVAEMRRHLRVFVDTNVFLDKPKPANSDAAYYPTDETIRKHVYKAQLRLRYSKMDQENLLQQVADWQQNYPDDNFSFMPASPASTSLEDEDIKVECVEQDDDDEMFPQLIPTTEATEFFFCHQTKFQRHLLYRYGNSICLLDATYRTTKYALPLFFLAVKTNVGYSVVGEFVVQHETKKSIKKGLHTFQQWVNESSDRTCNWKWQPKFFMTDYCEREIVAIEEVFPESFVFICDFHREQSWTRWVSKTDNGVTHCKDIILSMLRRCAHACTMTEYEDATNNLQTSSYWQSNSRLRNWFTKTWMAEAKRWVWANRHGNGMLVNTNNGLERQNKIFKYQFLEQRKNHNLSGMISTLLQDYLPTMMLKYIRDNATATDSFGRTYNTEVPVFLRNRPAQFIKHCLAKIELAGTINHKDVKHLGGLSFKVSSQSAIEKQSYVVNLDCGNGMPSCDCHNWTWTLLPCKHIFGVFAHTNYSWEDITEQYRNSPFFNIDDVVVKHPTGIPPSSNEEEDLYEVQEFECFGADSPFEDLPLAKKTPGALKALAIKCREKLSLLQTATYLCQDEEALNSLLGVLEEEIIRINGKLYKDHGLCEETPPKKRQKVEVNSKSKKNHSKLKLVKKSKRKEKSSTTIACATFETIVVDGIVENKVFQEGIADMVTAMSHSEWDDLMQDAKLTCSSQYAFDMIAQTAFTVLEECCPNEDPVEILQSLTLAHCPSLLTAAQQHRLALLLLATYVKKGKYHLQRDFEKEEAEASKAMADCIAAMKSMEDTTNANTTCKTIKVGLKKRKAEKHVTWSDELPSSSRTHLVSYSDIDQQKAQHHVDRIWDKSEESNYILANVYGFNITDVDIKSLKKGRWLTDQVMDGYLACLAQKELDKGVKVKHEVVSTMTSIINGTHVLNKKCRVMEYDFILGAYHQRGGHWDIVIVEPKKGAVYFYNPLGETAFQQRRAITSWRNYVNANFPLYRTSWHLETNVHAQQLDSCNCGVYCLMFAEKHLTGDTLLNISLSDIETKRKEIGCTFLLYEVYMDKLCPCCGFQISTEDRKNLLQCRSCERFFHKKNHCVGEILAASEGENFICKVC